ncbi:MAG TPA: hypothetical protein DCQ76_03805 [Ruminococcaceae bacterium]|mgnify:FL=1|nr:hypothetical protein [Oscillospiraceae bacterium]
MSVSGIKTAEKNTNDLMEELSDDKVSIENYIKDNTDSFVNVDLSNFWKGIIRKSGMTKSDIINKSDFSYVYFYDVINGRKTPSRDKIIRLALALKLSLDECQTALKFCGRSQLYPRIKRDSIIIHGINRNLCIYEVSDNLLSLGEEDLK